MSLLVSHEAIQRFRNFLSSLADVYVQVSYPLIFSLLKVLRVHNFVKFSKIFQICFMMPLTFTFPLLRFSHPGCVWLRSSAAFFHLRHQHPVESLGVVDDERARRVWGSPRGSCTPSPRKCVRGMREIIHFPTTHCGGLDNADLFLVIGGKNIKKKIAIVQYLVTKVSNYIFSTLTCSLTLLCVG